MSGRSTRSSQARGTRLGVAFLALMLVSCAATSAVWRAKEGALPTPLPPRLVVRVVGSVSDAQGDDPVGALGRALQEELSAADVTAEVMIHPQRPWPPPRVDVRVVLWDPGNSADRVMGSVLAYGVVGHGKVRAEVRYLDASGTPTFYGTVEGTVRSGFEASQAADAVGRAIGKAIAGGGR